ncbi:alpha-tocopherol transfer protein-like isoform X1 [Tribolium madens]|uniref:alpha-tocopherol transfer protein-like isoform X1 n=1 Tax=Tribolium madens TaxID=41895 RepID=UPI001CF75B96|nr:alpha-tocopherol transfer protein-like isoform X1 [Tribolium madens]
MEEVEQVEKIEKEKCVGQFRNLMKGNDILKYVPSNDDYLLRFLYTTSFDVIEAFKLMKLHYEFMLECPEWFTKDGPLSRKYIIEKNIRVLTPYRDRDGRQIYIIKTGNLDPSKMELFDVVGIDDCWVEFLADDLNFRQKGLCVIVDIANLTWRMYKWCTPYLTRTFMRKINTWPIKEYRIHVVNTNFIANSIIKIIWPFVNEHLKKVIKFHFDDWESLHEYINPNELPPEYRGSAVIDYKECYRNLFKKNDEIVNNFRTYRNVM